MAGRASVEFYVGLALRARGNKRNENSDRSSIPDGVTREDAYVIRCFKNGLAVFVSKWVSFVRHWLGKDGR